MSILDGVAEALVIRPGDTLLIRLASGLDAETSQQLSTLIKGELPDIKVLILGGAIEQIAAYRPDEEPRDG